MVASGCGRLRLLGLLGFRGPGSKSQADGKGEERLQDPTEQILIQRDSHQRIPSQGPLRDPQGVSGLGNPYDKAKTLQRSSAAAQHLDSSVSSKVRSDHHLREERLAVWSSALQKKGFKGSRLWDQGYMVEVRSTRM